MEERRQVRLDPMEYRLMINGLNTFRNLVLEEGGPTEDIDRLLLKVIDAPVKRKALSGYRVER